MRTLSGTAVLLALAARSFAAADTTVLFRDVSVIPMDRDTVLEHRDVVVRNGRIAAISPTRGAPPPPESLVIDGDGKFLLPGLFDMHVHLQKGGRANERLLLLFLAHGITGIRNMWGLPEHLLLRARVAQGEIPGPQIFTAGPILDGKPPLLASSLIIETPEQAVSMVNTQHKIGYDFLKVYDKLPREAYLALAAAAKESGMPVVGHVPLAVGLEGVLAAGQKSIEHLEGYIDAVESDDSPYRNRPDWRGRALAAQHIDGAKLERVARLTAQAGTWNCPTLIVIDKQIGRSNATPPPMPDDSEFACVPDEVKRYWRRTRAANAAPETVDMLRKGQEERRKIVLALNRAGAPLLAGTDSLNADVMPGASLVEELQSLVAAGLTPFEALTTATLEPARFLGMADQSGAIAPGMRADLILTNHNPLKNVSAAGDLAGVMIRGRWLPRSELQTMLATCSTNR